MRGAGYLPNSLGGFAQLTIDPETGRNALTLGLGVGVPGVNASVLYNDQSSTAFGAGVQARAGIPGASVVGTWDPLNTSTVRFQGTTPGTAGAVVAYTASNGQPAYYSTGVQFSTAPDANVNGFIRIPFSVDTLNQIAMSLAAGRDRPAAGSVPTAYAPAGYQRPLLIFPPSRPARYRRQSRRPMRCPSPISRSAVPPGRLILSPACPRRTAGEAPWPPLIRPPPTRVP